MRSGDNMIVVHLPDGVEFALLRVHYGAVVFALGDAAGDGTAGFEIDLELLGREIFDAFERELDPEASDE